eukprot:CAMPEP_0203937234 /NCGR_PEP_ID=MMETSP0359-20131031/74540_1 /ASSEMBLY_ACC=CAM_ASM_000338 /TAXON_ID=268821 /ORGANISM="Scrippsiella Hangoei, Strain SHTV-5" /LENGTH=337 /DNA_ID=CAMNT_0050867289 /DNA_START=26 /DNA_END=1040 /DNA_ORIENTATION=+
MASDADYPGRRGQQMLGSLCRRLLLPLLPMVLFAVVALPDSGIKLLHAVVPFRKALSKLPPFRVAAPPGHCAYFFKRLAKCDRPGDKREPSFNMDDLLLAFGLGERREELVLAVEPLVRLGFFLLADETFKNSLCGLSQQLCQLVGIVLLACLVPLKCPVVVAGLAERVKYVAAVIVAGRTHKFAPAWSHHDGSPGGGPPDPGRQAPRLGPGLLAVGRLGRAVAGLDPVCLIFLFVRIQETVAASRMGGNPAKITSQWFAGPASEQFLLFVSVPGFGSHFSLRGGRAGGRPPTQGRASEALSVAVLTLQVVAVAVEPSSNRLPLTGWSWGGCAASSW